MRFSGRKLIVLIFPLALGACAAAYKLTPGVPTAELTFLTLDTDAEVYICDFERHNLGKLGLSARSTSAGGQFFHGFTLGLSDKNKPIVPVVSQIVAGSRVQIIGSGGAVKSMGYVTTMKQCDYGFDLVPRAGARYKAEYSYDWKGGQCRMSVFEFDDGKQDWLALPPLPDRPACEFKK
jgi:hypothetical protein